MRVGFAAHRVCGLAPFEGAGLQPQRLFVPPL